MNIPSVSLSDGEYARIRACLAQVCALEHRCTPNIREVLSSYITSGTPSCLGQILEYHTPDILLQNAYHLCWRAYWSSLMSPNQDEHAKWTGRARASLAWLEDFLRNPRAMGGHAPES